MGILKLVQPAYTRCPGSVFGCIPPLYWTVGIGTVWQCDHCGRIWERVSRTDAAWVDITQRMSETTTQDGGSDE